jgi:hypothetical protein
MGTLGHGSEYCLLLLDLRNSWPNPLTTTLQVRPPLTLTPNTDTWERAYTVTEVIQPGHVHRLAIVLPRIYIAIPHAAVPSLNPANQRQFVVSTSKISPETERASREAFWFRHHMLQFVRGRWTEEGSGRHGEIELRGLRFSARMVEAIRLDDVAIEMHLSPDDSGDWVEDWKDGVTQLNHHTFSTPIDRFLTLKTLVRNRSPSSISPVLRLQPYLAGLPHNLALDLDKRLSWTGVLQVKLPLIPAGEAVESELGLVTLCAGMFEVGATVDEAEFVKAEQKEGATGDAERTQKGRERSNTQLMQGGDVLGEPKLRSWHAREPCVIIATRERIEK